MAFEGLKEKQSAMWGSAPFENVTGPLAPMHDDLVAHLAPAPGERLLDLGCGTGEIAFRAARLGADVVGADLASALIETAQRQAAGRGLEISFETADCENILILGERR